MEEHIYQDTTIEQPASDTSTTNNGEIDVQNRYSQLQKFNFS